MVKDEWKGHEIYCDSDENWRVVKTNQLCSDNYRVPCGYCGKESTEEDHDGCLETLRGVMNACCGHGNDKEAYVQFIDSFCIHGEDATIILKLLKKYSNLEKEGTNA